MRNGKKKEPNIDKLTRKQLITKCRGRGIAIGQYLAQIERLKCRLLAVPDEEEMLNCMLELDKKKEALTSLNAAYLNLLSTNEELQRDIETRAEHAAVNAKQIVNQGEKIDHLTTAVADFKEAWHAAGARATKADKHARELAEFYLVNIGQIINTSKLIVMGVKSIENKYKEE